MSLVNTHYYTVAENKTRTKCSLRITSKLTQYILTHHADDRFSPSGHCCALKCVLSS